MYIPCKCFVELFLMCVTMQCLCRLIYFQYPCKILCLIKYFDTGIYDLIRIHYNEKIITFTHKNEQETFK